MRTTHNDSYRIRQNADPFSKNRPFSAIFDQWVCTFATTPPQTGTSPPPNGGNCIIRAATRRRYAASQLLMLQNPHRYRQGDRRGHGEPGRSTHERRQGAAIARQLARGLRQSKTLFAQQQPHRTPSVQNSPSTSRTAPLPVQNSPSTPEMAQFGAFSACRESFVPLSPPRSRAGRILYRTRGRVGASHDSTTCPVRKAPEKPKGKAVVQAAAGW